MTRHIGAVMQPAMQSTMQSTRSFGNASQYSWNTALRDVQNAQKMDEAFGKVRLIVTCSPLWFAHHGYATGQDASYCMPEASTQHGLLIATNVCA